MSKLSDFVKGGGGAFFDLGDLHVVSEETLTSSGEYTVGAGGDLIYISVAGGAGGGGGDGSTAVNGWGGSGGLNGGGSQVSIGGSVLALAKGGSRGAPGIGISFTNYGTYITPAGSPLPPARLELNPLTGVDILANAGEFVGVDALPIPRGGVGGLSYCMTYRDGSGRVHAGGGVGGSPASGDFLLRVNQGQVFVATVGAGGARGGEGGFVRFILCRE